MTVCARASSYSSACNVYRCALKIFPAKAIFICDNGPWEHPPDRTQDVCRAISEEVDPSGAEQYGSVLLSVPCAVY